MKIQDNGPQPNAFNIEKATVKNKKYRVVAWTGKQLQVTLMSIPPGESIGLECHPGTDQFLRLDGGKGTCVMGPSKDNLTFKQKVEDGWSIQVPAGMWHDIINTGKQPLQVYAVYAPVHHAKGTVQKTAKQAAKDEANKTDEPPAWTAQPAAQPADKSAPDAGDGSRGKTATPTEQKKVPGSAQVKAKAAKDTAKQTATKPAKRASSAGKATKAASNPTKAASKPTKAASSKPAKSSASSKPAKSSASKSTKPAKRTSPAAGTAKPTASARTRPAAKRAAKPAAKPSKTTRSSSASKTTRKPAGTPTARKSGAKS